MMKKSAFVFCAGVALWLSTPVLAAPSDMDCDWLAGQTQRRVEEGCPPGQTGQDRATPVAEADGSGDGHHGRGSGKHGRHHERDRHHGTEHEDDGNPSGNSGNGNGNGNGPIIPPGPGNGNPD